MYRNNVSSIKTFFNIKDSKRFWLFMACESIFYPTKLVDVVARSCGVAHCNFFLFLFYYAFPNMMASVIVVYKLVKHSHDK